MSKYSIQNMLDETSYFNCDFQHELLEEIQEIIKHPAHADDEFLICTPDGVWLELDAENVEGIRTLATFNGRGMELAERIRHILGDFYGYD